MHDDLVVNVRASKIQCDEIWSFTYAKQKNVATAKAAPDGAGDVWTWTALDPDSKLMVSYFVGDRTKETARIMMCDLKRRLVNRVQLTTDGHPSYLSAVYSEFGNDVDYAMLDKVYGKGPVSRSAEARYSPVPIIGIKKRCCVGDPDPAHISTSHVERSNLSIRMHNKRFARMSNAFSKKLDNHIHMLALYFAFYNFCRVRKSLRVTPAMKAGITSGRWGRSWRRSTTTLNRRSRAALQGQGVRKLRLRHYQTLHLVPMVTATEKTAAYLHLHRTTVVRRWSWK